MYIGNTVITQGFTPQVDFFSGNASTTAFTLSRPVASTYQMIVVVANVTQNPSSAFTVTGNTITFASAPPNGTNNIWVEYTSLITQTIVPTGSYQVAGPVFVGSTIGYTDTGILQTFASNVNSYNQIILQNLSSGASASTNFNVSNNNGTSTTNFGEFGINSSGFSGTGSFSQAGYTYLASASTDLVIGTYGNNPIHFVVNSGATDAAIIDVNGNFGLGVTPSAWKTGNPVLQIGSGQGALEGISSALNIWNNLYRNSSGQFIYQTTGAAGVYALNAGQHIWYNAPSGTAGTAATLTQVMTLDNSGNLTYSPGGNTTPTAVGLTINSPTGAGGGALYVNNNHNVNGDINTVLNLGGNANNTASYFLIATQSGVRNCLFIYGNGNVVNNNNSYGTLSDAKLKTNVVLAETQWNDVKALGQVMKKFNLISDPTGPLQLGWVAQDVQAISAGLVFTDQDRDSEGKPTGATTLGVNTSVAQLKAFKALSEAMIRIEELEARLKAANIA